MATASLGRAAPRLSTGGVAFHVGDDTPTSAAARSSASTAFISEPGRALGSLAIIHMMARSTLVGSSPEMLEGSGGSSAICRIKIVM